MATAGVIGGVGGAGRGGVLAAPLAGAAGLAAADTVARARQRPGEIPALWSRILASGALAAPVGWIADRVTGAGPVPVATVAGAAAGALGLRPQKVLFGPVAVAAIGLGLRAGARQRRVPGAVAAAAAVAGYRVASALVVRGPQPSLLGEGGSPPGGPLV